MLDIRHVVAIVLFLINGLWKIIRSGCDYQTLEEQLQVLSQQVTTRLLVWTLEKIDEEILKTRDKKRYKCIRFEERTGVTIFGEFTIKRRLYKDTETNTYHFLLDEALGWASRQRLSPKMREIALDLATEIPFRRAARIMSQLVPGITTMSVWEIVKQAGEAVQKEGEALRQAVFEDGVILEGKHNAGVLFIEADGVVINQQKSARKRAEVKLLTAYDGKKKSKDGKRRSLQHRYSVATTRESEKFWEESSAYLANQWKMDKIEKMELGGDGSSWVKEGIELFPNTVYHLDRYHLRKNLTECLAFSTTIHQAVVEAIEQKNLQALIDILDRAAKKANKDTRRKKINKLKKYLLENWEGIISQLPEGGLGAIEGQVRHTIARRMKRIGARWSPEGTDRMARLLAAKANNELSDALSVSKPINITLAKAVGDTPINIHRSCSVEDTGAWLQAHVPAIDTPYLTGYMLRKIVKIVPELL